MRRSGSDEVKQPEALGWPTEPAFYVPRGSLAFFREAVARVSELEAEWNPARCVFRGVSLGASTSNAPFSRELPQTGIARFHHGKSGSKFRRARPRSSHRWLLSQGSNIHRWLGRSQSVDQHWKKAPATLRIRTSSGREFRFARRRLVVRRPQYYTSAFASTRWSAPFNGMPRMEASIHSERHSCVLRYLRPLFAWLRSRSYKSVFVFTHDSIAVGETVPTHEPI